METRDQSRTLTLPRVVAAAVLTPPTGPDEPSLEGRRLGDFDVLGRLGRGGLATVYLARQRSLGRLVALKVSDAGGAEARSLARLEHPHIVQVFQAGQDADGRQLLGMQYVNGPSLDRVLAHLWEEASRPPSGPALRAAIARLGRPDPSTEDGPGYLDGMDFFEATAWLGGRLADALASAHAHGVLHRDVKPANVLLCRSGKPLLADFNLAGGPGVAASGVAASGVAASGVAASGVAAPGGPATGTDELFGGTLKYMAPEHLDALDPASGVTPAAVDERSDVYSLGLVLYETLTGQVPGATAATAARLTRVECARALAEARRADPPSLEPRGVPLLLERAVRRCLAARPQDRFQHAGELAAALDGFREHRGTLRHLPRGGRLTRAMVWRPFWALVVLVLLPHLLATVVNVLYNQTHIVSHLSDSQQEAFAALVVVYNTLAYPVGLGLLYRLVAPVFRGYCDLLRVAGPTALGAQAVRARTLRLPAQAAVLSCACWLPGAVFFPAVLDGCCGPVPGCVYRILGK